MTWSAGFGVQYWLLLLKWVKRTKHSCRQPQAKKCQGSKSSTAAPKMAPGLLQPLFLFFWDSNVLKWEFTVKSIDWTNSLTRAIFFLSLLFDSIGILRLMRHCYASECISDVKPIHKKLMLNLQIDKAQNWFSYY